MNEVWILSRGDRLNGVFTSYRKAVQALMMRAHLPLTDFMSDFGVDFFTAANDEVWAIEPKEVDKI